MLLAVLLLGGVMVVSFGASTWSTQQTEMPAKATAPCDAEPNTVSCQLFETYAIAVLIMGMILAACMVGAVYMAKMEGKP
jgi:NADH:ubiquinone oxidoreductase subunit 6 (subunit J)